MQNVTLEYVDRTFPRPAKRVLVATISLFIGMLGTQAAWLSQYGASYSNRGTITPQPGPAGQTSSASFTPSNYKYPFWTLNAVAGTTYYFDLCGSSGSGLTNTRLRIHDGSYGLYSQDPGTQVIANVSNGCSGSGTGYSRIIWTAPFTATYYLESAASSNSTFWGVQNNQTVVLRYYTLPSEVSTCGGVFADMGSNGINGSTSGYGNNESWTRTYQPQYPGNLVQAEFTSFSTEAGSDLLYVYDGSSTTAPQVPGSPFSGSNSPGTITSTAADGALTFRFVSDGSVVSTGWTATMSCICITPVVEVHGSSTFCEGDTSTLTAVLTAGAGGFQWQLDGTDIAGAEDATIEITGPGTYTAVVTNPAGCFGESAGTLIVIEPLPVAGFTFDVNDSTVSFTNGSTNGLTYSWDPGDGSAIVTTSDLEHTYGGAGSYTVTLIATNACGSDTLTQVVVLTVGINEAAGFATLELFPNPANDQLSVRWESLGREPVALRVFNIVGAIVMQKDLGSLSGTQQLQLGVESLPQGEYLLQLNSPSGTVVRKFTVY